MSKESGDCFVVPPVILCQQPIEFQTCAHMLVVCNFFIYQKNTMEVKNIEDNLEILCFEGYDKYWKVLTKNICRCQA